MISPIFVVLFFLGGNITARVQYRSSLDTIPKTDAITIFENFQPQLHFCDTRIWLRRSAQKALSSGSNFLISNESKIREDGRISIHHIWALFEAFLAKTC